MAIIEKGYKGYMLFGFERIYGEKPPETNYTIRMPINKSNMDTKQNLISPETFVIAAPK